MYMSRRNYITYIYIFIYLNLFLLSCTFLNLLAYVLFYLLSAYFTFNLTTPVKLAITLLLHVRYLKYKINFDIYRNDYQFI